VCFSSRFIPRPNPRRVIVAQPRPRPNHEARLGYGTAAFGRLTLQLTEPTCQPPIYFRVVLPCPSQNNLLFEFRFSVASRLASRKEVQSRKAAITRKQHGFTFQYSSPSPIHSASYQPCLASSPETLIGVIITTSSLQFPALPVAQTASSDSSAFPATPVAPSQPHFTYRLPALQPNHKFHAPPILFPHRNFPDEARRFISFRY
jgi:hypothetical protein